MHVRVNFQRKIGDCWIVYDDYRQRVTVVAIIINLTVQVLLAKILLICFIDYDSRQR